MINFYWLLDHIPNNDFWNTLFEAFPTSTIIAGDANIGHHLLGGSRINTAGNYLMENLLYATYVYLNDGTPTHITLPS